MDAARALNSPRALALQLAQEADALARLRLDLPAADETDPTNPEKMANGPQVG